MSNINVESRINKVAEGLKIIYSPPTSPLQIDTSPCHLPLPHNSFRPRTRGGKIRKIPAGRQTLTPKWLQYSGLFTSFFFKSEKIQSHPQPRFQWDFIPADCWDENRLPWIWLELGLSVIKSKSAQRHLWHLDGRAHSCHSLLIQRLALKVRLTD